MKKTFEIFCCLLPRLLRLANERAQLDLDEVRRAHGTEVAARLADDISFGVDVKDAVVEESCP